MPKHRIVIKYCRKCRWQLRSAWYAQEILATFEEEVSEVALAPGEGGVFQVLADNQCVWDRASDGGFPEIKLLKQRVRDIIAPEKTLGHIDRTSPEAER